MLCLRFFVCSRGSSREVTPGPSSRLSSTTDRLLHHETHRRQWQIGGRCRGLIAGCSHKSILTGRQRCQQQLARPPQQIIHKTPLLVYGLMRTMRCGRRKLMAFASPDAVSWSNSVNGVRRPLYAAINSGSEPTRPSLARANSSRRFAPGNRSGAETPVGCHREPCAQFIATEHAPRMGFPPTSTALRPGRRPAGRSLHLRTHPLTLPATSARQVPACRSEGRGAAHQGHIERRQIGIAHAAMADESSRRFCAGSRNPVAVTPIAK